MPSIKNSNVNSFISTQFTAENIWLGAKRVSENSFQWEDGSEWNYSNWKKPIAPNNLNNDEDCIVTNWKNSGQGEWNDVNCDRSFRTVCQLPSTGAGKPTTPATASQGGV